MIFFMYGNAPFMSGMLWKGRVGKLQFSTGDPAPRHGLRTTRHRGGSAYPRECLESSYLVAFGAASGMRGGILVGRLARMIRGHTSRWTVIVCMISRASCMCCRGSLK
jgi:hypothetical protein